MYVSTLTYIERHSFFSKSFSVVADSIDGDMLENWVGLEWIEIGNLGWDV